jgi:hypothetical protein
MAYNGQIGSCQSGSCVPVGSSLGRCGTAYGEACYGFDVANCMSIYAADTSPFCAASYPSDVCHYNRVFKVGPFSNCNYPNTNCECEKLDTCPADCGIVNGEELVSCEDNNGCVPNANSKCISFGEPFECGENTCSANQGCCPWKKEDDGTMGDCYALGVLSCQVDTPSPENKNLLGMVVDARCNDCDDNDCNNAIDCADQACSSSPFISPVCACDYGICENDEKPMWRMSGGVCGYTCYHADTCLPQSNPCAPTEYSCAALAPTCLDTSLSLSGSACCYNYAGFSASGGGPVAYCCYRGRDNDKKPCPAGGTSCSYDALGKPVLINNNGNNICDPSHGWKCDGTSQAVGCCGDADCAGLTCSSQIDPSTGQSYGPRKKTCDLTGAHGLGTQYTCQCDPCRVGYSSEDCANSCCDADIKGLQRGDCTPANTVSTYNYAKWLCA